MTQPTPRSAAGSPRAAAAGVAPRGRRRSRAARWRRDAEARRPTGGCAARSPHVGHAKRRARVVMGDDVLAVGEPPARGGEVEGQQRLLAADHEAGMEPAGGQVRAAPHGGAAGDEAEDARSRPPRRLRQRAGRHRRARRVDASLLGDEDAPRDEAEARVGVEGAVMRPRAPGAHHESSSLKATTGVCRRRTPTVRAAAPRFSASATTSTSGWPARTAAGLPSVEALSTTTTGARSGAAAWRSSARSRSARRFRVATTMPIGAATRVGSPAARAVKRGGTGRASATCTLPDG